MASADRMPVVYIAHGGGPMPLLGKQPGYVKHFQELPTLVPMPPKAILMVSAHWEETVPTVQTHPKPPLYFDYGGFPDETYKYTYPCSGSPELAERVTTLLKQSGITCNHDNERGYDHGTFVPMMIAWPDADVPVTQLSLITGLNAAKHVQMGHALQALRDEGILIIGSGMSFHNMRAFFGQYQKSDIPGSVEFDEWLTDACTNPTHTVSEGISPNKRAQLLGDWLKAPNAKFCHPREEHLIPLMVCAGAAGGDHGKKIWSTKSDPGGFQISAFMFG